MDFETFLKSKNEHFACEGLQKSRFRTDEYPRPIRIDFGLIFGRSGPESGKENRSRIDIDNDLDQ